MTHGSLTLFADAIKITPRVRVEPGSPRIQALDKNNDKRNDFHNVSMLCCQYIKVPIPQLKTYLTMNLEIFLGHPLAP